MELKIVGGTKGSISFLGVSSGSIEKTYSNYLSLTDRIQIEVIYETKDCSWISG